MALASGAVIIELLGADKGLPVRFTCVNATTIEKGTILELGDNRTVAANSGAAVFAGIAAAEKVASDGATTIAAYTRGIFDLTCHGLAGITVGSLVSLSGANVIKTATATDVEGGLIVGKALETAAASEVIAVAVGVY